MEKDKPPGLPLPSGRHSGFLSAGNALNSFGQSSNSNRFSHDISKMPDNPPKTLGHRRAHSEILTLPDDISFDSDLGVVGAGNRSSYSDDTEDLFSMYLDMNKFNSPPATLTFQVGESSSATGAPATAPVASGAGTGMNGANANVTVGFSEKPRVRHQHSQSMDGLISITPEMLMSGSEEAPPADSKKAMSAAELAELALINPKRAKRIWANRQSAARSKERKMRYIAELERKLQMLQTQATALSAQLALLQRDTDGMTAENSELKLLLQTMEEQFRLRNALNDAMDEEIHRMRVLTGQPLPNGGPMMNYAPFGANQQYYPNNPAMPTLLTAQQFQQLQIQSQNHLHPFQPQHQTGEMGAGDSMASPRHNNDAPDASSTTSKD